MKHKQWQLGHFLEKHSPNSANWFRERTMGSSIGIFECAAGEFCRGKQTPARLRLSDERHARSIELGYCAECRKHYGSNLPLGGRDHVASENISNKKIHSFSPLMGAFEESQAKESPQGLVAVAAVDHSSELSDEEYLEIASYERKIDFSSFDPDEEGIVDGEPDTNAKMVFHFPSLSTDKITPQALNQPPLSGGDRALMPKEDEEKIGEADVGTNCHKKEAAGGNAFKKTSFLSARPFKASGVNNKVASKKPNDAYKKIAIMRAEAIKGASVSDYEEAVGIIANQSRKTDLIHSDVVDAMEKFEGIIERHRDIDIAAIATSLMLNENLIVADFGSGSLEAIMRAAVEEDMEYQIVDAKLSAAGDAEAIQSLESLAWSLSRFSDDFTKGRVVIVKGLSAASTKFKRELIDAIVNRKIGQLPIPPEVRIAIAESGVFHIEDFPPEIVVQSICVAIKDNDKNPVDVVMSAMQTRRWHLEQQLKAAVEAKDEKREESLRLLLKKTGYVGAWDNSNHPSQQDEQLDVIVDSLARKAGSMTRDDKASRIFDITSPEKSQFREKVASKLLTGVNGKEFARNSLKNYLIRNSGPMAGMPTIEDVLVGIRTVEEVRDTLLGNGLPYVTYLAIELRTSLLVDGVMRRGGDEAYKVRQLFLALTDADNQAALGVAKDRPYFVK